jgi:hypothetical protein
MIILDSPTLKVEYAALFMTGASVAVVVLAAFGENQRGRDNQQTQYHMRPHFLNWSQRKCRPRSGDSGATNSMIVVAFYQLFMTFTISCICSILTNTCLCTLSLG